MAGPVPGATASMPTIIITAPRMRCSASPAAMPGCGSAARAGRSVELSAGDVVVIPAGIAHKREAASGDLLVIGAYPKGQRPDMCLAEAAARDRALAAIAAVPLPEADPVTGRADPLLLCWKG